MENKQIKHIGTLTGDILLFGGAYSNLQALNELKKRADQFNIPASHVINTGDIVGYCAQPEEVVQTIKDWGIHCILGNVEIQLRDGLDDCGCEFEEGSRCDIFAKQWFPFAKKNLSKKAIDWMSSIPDFLSFSYNNKKVVVLHGGVDNVSQFIFKSTPVDVKTSLMNQVDADVVIAGHCGLPFNHKMGDKLWVNPGVIGMPANDGMPEVWFAILSVVDGEIIVKHQSFDYNYEIAAELMKKKHLPFSYTETLQTGIWDNCDILPDVETNAQGEPILFD